MHITHVDHETKTITVRSLPRHLTNKQPEDHESLFNCEWGERYEYEMIDGKLVPR
jgi:hypothetical protein